MKNSRERSAICPVMKPLTKSYAEDVLKELEASVEGSLKSYEAISTNRGKNHGLLYS